MNFRLLARDRDSALGTPRDGVVWLVLAAMAFSLLLAFWAVCSSQVRKAQARDAARPAAAAASCDPGFALPAMGQCKPAMVAGTR